MAKALAVAVAASLVSQAAAQPTNSTCNSATTFYSSKYQALLLNGSTVVNYADYAGKVLIVTNVASF